MAKMSGVDWAAYILLVVGGVNWGIYGISRFAGKAFDLVSWLPSWLANTVFALVGIAGLYGIVTGIKLVSR